MSPPSSPLSIPLMAPYKATENAYATLLWQIFSVFSLRVEWQRERDRERCMFCSHNNELNRDETWFLHCLPILHPRSYASFCSLYRMRQCKAAIFPTYIHINVCLPQAPNHSTLSIHTASLSNETIWCSYPLWFRVYDMYQMKSTGKIQSPTISNGNLQNF